MKALKIILVTIVVLMAIGTVANVVNIMATTNTDSPNKSNSEVKGFVMDLDTFNAGCKQGAMEDGVVTEDQATTYCTCVYNNGIEKFGAEGLTNQVTNLGETDTMTPDLNIIVNKCIQYTLNVQSI